MGYDPAVTPKSFAYYRMVRELGRGGMGAVWLAHDTRLDRPVALKVLHAGRDGGSPLAALLREARAASALNHPNVCTVYEVAEYAEAAYIAMEFVEGRTLAARIAEGPIGADECLAVGAQIASALAHAHGRGVVHRDVKSANVMLGHEGHVKVLDFGLAGRVAGGDGERSLAGTTADATAAATGGTGAAGMAGGTLPYLAPEVLQGGRADACADLWGLGVILHEMCAGRRPFAGGTPFTLAAAILRGEAEPLPEGTPERLRAVIVCALAREPERRFPDAAAFRDALRAAATGDGGAAAGAGARRIETLAVLPFENLSRDDAQEFLADGMTEAITAGIARLGSLRVISRTSAMRFKGQRRPLPEIARELHADAVVEGSMLHAGERVRITAQLIDARTDEHLWAESYDRDVRDILALHDDVSRAIVGGVRARLGGAAADPEAPAIAAPRRVDPAAYEEYLRGRHAWAKRTPADLRRAIAHYERVIELDPANARAYAGIAECYGVIGFQGQAAPRSSFAPARAAVARALALDPTIAAAHAAAGYVALHYEWDLDASAASFAEAIRLDPDDSNARHWHALLLASRGERDAAVEEIRTAMDLDPLALIVRAASGLIRIFFGEHDAAIAECREALDMQPGYMPVRISLAKALVHAGDPAGALEVSGGLVREFPGAAFLLATHGLALAACGRGDEAWGVARELEALAKGAYVRKFERALVATALGQRDEALGLLEQPTRSAGTG